MTTAAAPGAFDLGAFARATESRDADTLTALYADDAVIEIIDRDATPRAPHVLQGRNAIGAFMSDLCARDLTHTVERALATPDRAAVFERCRYPDGTGVAFASVFDIADGRIHRQLAVQAWDE